MKRPMQRFWDKVVFFHEPDLFEAPILLSATHTETVGGKRCFRFEKGLLGYLEEALKVELDCSLFVQLMCIDDLSKDITLMIPPFMTNPSVRALTVADVQLQVDLCNAWFTGHSQFVYVAGPDSYVGLTQSGICTRTKEGWERSFVQGILDFADAAKTLSEPPEDSSRHEKQVYYGGLVVCWTLAYTNLSSPQSLVWT